MAAQFLYSTNAELMEIERDLLPELTLQDPIFRFFPIVEHETSTIYWDQKDKLRGLQNIRGYNGEPVKVFREGAARYFMEPGVYGDFDEVDEKEITERTKLGSFANKPVDIDDLIRGCQDRLMSREVARIKWVLWTLLTTGTVSVPDVKGQVLFKAQYTFQTFTASVAWSTPATSTPVKDLRAVQLLSRGSSVSYGRGSTLFVNRKTMNDILANTNAADIGRPINNAPMIDQEGLNRIMVAQDLPTFEVYDEGYINEAGTFTLFIPNDVGVLVGKRTNGDPLGEYVMTMNANIPGGGAGSYTHVVDSLNTGTPVPRKIQVHKGHNGGPAFWYPGGVVLLDLTP